MAVADDVIVNAVVKLREIIRDSETIARTDKTEFMVILQDDGEGAADHVRRRIKDTFSGPMKIEGLSVNIDSQIGVSSFPDDGDSPMELINAARDDMDIDSTSMMLR